MDVECGEAGEHMLSGGGGEEGEDGFGDGGAYVAGDRERGEERVLLLRIVAGVFEEFGEDGGCRNFR